MLVVEALVIVMFASRSISKVPAPAVQVRLESQLRVANTGSAALEPTKSCPFVPTDSGVIAPVPEPIKTPWSVRVEAPVPPSATAMSVPFHVPERTVPRYEFPETVRLVVEALVVVIPVKVGVAGMFQVWAVPEEVIVHKLPPVEVAKVCEAPVSPLSEVIPEPEGAAQVKVSPIVVTNSPAPQAAG